MRLSFWNLLRIAAGSDRRPTGVSHLHLVFDVLGLTVTGQHGQHWLSILAGSAPIGIEAHCLGIAFDFKNNTSTPAVEIYTRGLLLTLSPEGGALWDDDGSGDAGHDPEPLFRFWGTPKRYSFQ